MIGIRDMQHLVALAQHRHFARAAEACQISQPAFSMRIRNLEDRLGVEIVRRGNRFLGFTEHGDILVRRARGILEDTEALEQEINAASGIVSGKVVLGVVPTALAYASQLCIALHQAHPGIRMRIDSTTSLSIQQRLEEGTFDAGLTYDDSVSPDQMRVDFLYSEEYVLLAPRAMIAEGVLAMGWSEAAHLPLSLLEPDMQNRRILDRIFSSVGATPVVIAETNGFVSSIIMARQGVAATIVPKVLLEGLGLLEGVVAIELSDEVERKSICLVTPRRRSRLPAVEAMRALAVPSD